MTQLRPMRVAREHPVAVSVVAGVIAVQAIWMAEAACARMTVPECLIAAIVLVAAASVLALVVRAGWLAATTTRALAALPRAAIPEPLQAAAHRAGITRLRCLAGTDRTAFCAGLCSPVCLRHHRHRETGCETSSPVTRPRYSEQSQTAESDFASKRYASPIMFALAPQQSAAPLRARYRETAQPD
jgi:hypothetical protein